MMENRRTDDLRITKIETTIDKIQDDVNLIKTKIFNGFSSKIDSTENKVSYIDTQNKSDHNELKNDIKLLSSKFDKMLWFMITSSISIIVGIVISIVKGLI